MEWKPAVISPITKLLGKQVNNNCAALLYSSLGFDVPTTVRGQSNFGLYLCLKFVSYIILNRLVACIWTLYNYGTVSYEHLQCDYIVIKKYYTRKPGNVTTGTGSSSDSWLQ